MLSSGPDIEGFIINLHGYISSFGETTEPIWTVREIKQNSRHCFVFNHSKWQRVILLKAGKGLASDVIANCCIQNFSGNITKWIQSPKTNIFSESATVALFWKASKFNLHSLGKKPQNRLRIAQEKEQQPQHLLKGQKVKKLNGQRKSKRLQVLYKAEQSLKNQKIVGQTDGKCPLSQLQIRIQVKQLCAVKGE